MTRHYDMDWVLLPHGWSAGARLTVDDDGRIAAIDTGAAGARGGSAERVAGYVVPGMPNAHSHAFQRGMAGNAEYRQSSHDSFWTWRHAMYGLANRIEPDELRVLATQLFIEMLQAGYTSVAEFHYVHRRRDGGHYPAGEGLWEAVVGAAAAAGIGLTLLPTLYQTSDFGAQPLRADQARFASDTDWFLRHIAERVARERVAAGRGTAVGTLRTGAAFHSLRAVPLGTLKEAAAALAAMDAGMPLHIHVAEQLQEVASSLAHTGKRPIELLLDTGLVDGRWCLVHATHATAAELRGVAATGATVCVSISTEANLGDGFFETSRFLAAGGRICVGSDSQATVCPAEELRWLEYQQRLRKKRRAVLAGAGAGGDGDGDGDAHVGQRLWRDAARYGAQALGQNVGTLEVGRRADWLVLDAAHPTMAGATPATALDHLVFAGGRAAIRDVMVAGRWVVQNGRHATAGVMHASFASLMQRLASRGD